MEFQEFTGDQIRRTIDAEQRYSTYRDAIHKLHQSYRGSMTFKTVKGQDYLYHVVDGIAKSMGPRNPETEEIAQSFQKGRERLRQRRDTLQVKIDREARVDRAMGIGSAPATAADILRKLDRHGLLGRGISVIGTNAIYAYARMAGGQISSDLLATGDIDLLFDSRTQLRMLHPDTNDEGLIGLLRKVDSSFEPIAPGAFRATNDEGYMVDLIQPQFASTTIVRSAITGIEHDLQAAEIKGLEWLQNVPRSDHILIDERGQPFPISVPDPRAFALHKLWVSERPERDVGKKRRDLGQAKLVAKLVDTYLSNRDFSDPALNAFPVELRQRAPELLV